MVLERLLIVLLVFLAGMALYWAWRYVQARRLRRLATADLPESVQRLAGRAGPAILYFTAEDCVQCRTRQAPILERLRRQWQVAVHSVDAPNAHDLVRHYGIMTVPSTVVLNQELRPAAINHGLADLTRLQEQLQRLTPQA